MIESVQALYFSPTGGTRRIVSTITKNIDLKEQPEIDLTIQKDRDRFRGEVAGDVLVIASPVYAGTIPYPFLESLNRLEGNDKWAVPVGVYGNRSAESIIEEMAKILRKRGFKILAAATFISKHSFAVRDHPWGIGRPDEKDLAKAAEFGRKVTEKAKSNPSEISLSENLIAHGWGFATPLKEDQIVGEMPEGYHKRVIDRTKWLWMIDSSERDACTDCGSCVDSCPTHAIESETLKISEDLCIRCAACVMACSSSVMKLVYSDQPAALEIFAGLDKAMAVRKEPAIFI